MKNANNFRISKVQPRGVAYRLLDFLPISDLRSYKSVAFLKKACSEAYCRKASLMLRVSQNTSIQIKVFILPLKKIVGKYLIIAYPQEKKTHLKKFNTKRRMSPENCPRQTPVPKE